MAALREAGQVQQSYILPMEAPDGPELLPRFGPQTSASAGKFPSCLPRAQAGVTTVLNPTQRQSQLPMGSLGVQAKATDLPPLQSRQ